MTLRRELKLRLSKLKSYYRNELPALQDCSMVYGDNFYNDSYKSAIESSITELEAAIKGIDSHKKLYDSKTKD